MLMSTKNVHGCPCCTWGVHKSEFRGMQIAHKKKRKRVEKRKERATWKKEARAYM